MLVSYNWVKQYVDLSDSLTPEELALKLTMTTVEVEGVEHQGKNLDNIVVGKVTKVEKHPDADKLNVCTVNDGQEDFTVVCGGSNVVEGMLCAFGKIGARVQWHGEGKLIELKKAKIRGVESYGMICAASEIGLGAMYPSKDEREILDLSDTDAKPGTSLANVLGLNDVVLDIDNKSMTHRPDLWGHYGMAREVAAAYHKKLKAYEPVVIKKQDTSNLPAGRHGKQISNIKLQVDVQDTELCPRYMAVALGGITIAQSPEWLQQRLLAVGLKPINNIVDITNYILCDLGQPMHAFDAKHLKGTKNKEQGTNIVVRRAEAGEKFTTLDDNEHELTSDMLVIADSEKVVALAGVMGGQNSEIKDDTTMIVFEAANFDATNVRRTATKLGIRTESSARFEKSLDPNNAELALRRAVELTLELCPDAKVVSNVVDESHFNLNQGPIELSLIYLKERIGKEIPTKEVIKILESLGFETKEKKEILYVTIPTWRATKDISIADDLVEEIARVYGFGNIETSMPKFNIAPPEVNHLRKLERHIKDICVYEFGYTESLNYSFVSPQLLSKLNIEIDTHIELDNPIAKDRPLLRRSLLPNVLDLVDKNMHDRDTLRLCEIGKVFHSDESGIRMAENSDELLPRQDVMWTVVYSDKKVYTPFFDMSSMVSYITDQLGVVITLEDVVEAPVPYHPGRVAQVVIDGEEIGYIGELHPAQQRTLGIDSRVAMCEINLNRLLEYSKDRIIYHGVPAYPPVLRDIAFVVDTSVMHADVVAAISNIDDLITHVELFDVFTGEKLGKNKKSLAYHITYLSKEKTLEAGDIDKVHEKVGKMLEKKFDAEMRK